MKNLKEIYKEHLRNSLSETTYGQLSSMVVRGNYVNPREQTRDIAQRGLERIGKIMSRPVNIPPRVGIGGEQAYLKARRERAEGMVAALGASVPRQFSSTNRAAGVSDIGNPELKVGDTSKTMQQFGANLSGLAANQMRAMRLGRG
jgi:hypothetical protein